jgi:hypothetical protein
MKLLKKFYQIIESRRRQREVRKIRREFARAGYPLDQFRDSQIEAALRWNTEVGFTINAKTIYRTLKRLKVSRGEQDRTLLIRGVNDATYRRASVNTSPTGPDFLGTSPRIISGDRQRDGDDRNDHHHHIE